MKNWEESLEKTGGTGNGMMQEILHNYVNDDMLQVWLIERSCLVEYTPDLQRKSLYRGFVCSLQFVKQTGNKSELHLLS